MTNTVTTIDPQTVDEFRTHGVTIVRGLFTPDEVALVERGIDRNLAEPSPMFKVASRADDPGSFVEDFCNWQRIDEFRVIAFESRAADVDGFDNCSMWMPVDPVAPESTLEFIAGSHRRGWLMPRSFMDSQAKWFPEGTLEEIPDIESHRDGYDIRGWAMAPGDAVFFHMLTLHHSYGVPGTARRRAFSLRFLGDDMVYSPRPW